MGTNGRFFEIIRSTATTQPFLASLIIRGLYVLDGIKDYTLIVLGVPFKFYFASSFIVNTFYIMKNVLIGYQLKEIGELLTHQKKWSSVDLAEKFFFGAVLFLVVFSFTATAVFTVWANRRMKGKFDQSSKQSKTSPRPETWNSRSSPART